MAYFSTTVFKRQLGTHWKGEYEQMKVYDGQLETDGTVNVARLLSAHLIKGTSTARCGRSSSTVVNNWDGLKFAGKTRPSQGQRSSLRQIFYFTA